MASRESGVRPRPASARQIRIFCDADVLVAGSASTTGASHVLLKLSEVTLIECLTSLYAIEEAERNLRVKLPDDVPTFRLIVRTAIIVVPSPSASAVRTLTGQANTKDLPILAAALACRADSLTTFNARHFRPRNSPPIILQPGEVLTRIRASLARLLD